VFPDSVPKRRHIKFIRRGITQKKEYNMAIVENQEQLTCIYIIYVAQSAEITHFVRAGLLSNITVFPLTDSLHFSDYVMGGQKNHTLK